MYSTAVCINSICCMYSIPKDHSNEIIPFTLKIVILLMCTLLHGNIKLSQLFSSLAFRITYSSLCSLFIHTRWRLLKTLKARALPAARNMGFPAPLSGLPPSPRRPSCVTACPTLAHITALPALPPSLHCRPPCYRPP